jgi:hypothetical protein
MYAGPLRSQHGQDGPQHVEGTEDVRVENRASLRVGGFLHGAEQSVAGVVRDDVDPAESGDGIIHSGMHRRGLAHIGRDCEQHCIAVEFEERRGVPCESGNRFAGLEGLARQFEADARAGTGDQPGT